MSFTDQCKICKHKCGKEEISLKGFHWNIMECGEMPNHNGTIILALQYPETIEYKTGYHSKHFDQIVYSGGKKINQDILLAWADIPEYKE